MDRQRLGTDCGYGLDGASIIRSNGEVDGS